MRFVWKIEPLASMEDDDTVAAAAATIQRYLHGDVYAATRKCSLHRIEACGAY